MSMSLTPLERPKSIGTGKTSPDHRLHTRCHSWFEATHTAVAYNITKKPTTDWQVGGVHIWSRNQMTHRINQTGCDPTGLGRWIWVQYRGKNQTSVRFVSAYRPSQPFKGFNTAYAQQRHSMLKRNDNRCPRKEFVEDLNLEIGKWREKGDAIIIAVDVNEDIQSCEFTSMLQRHNIQEKYCRSTKARHPQATTEDQHRSTDFTHRSALTY